MHHIELSDAQSPFVLTLDVGTSSVRLLCFDAGARQIRGMEARRSIVVHSDAHGSADIDVDALFELCVAVIDDVVALLGATVHQVAAVAIDTMATTMVGLDATGRAVGPLRTYADTQSDASAVWLRSMYHEHEVHRRTGCMLRPNYWPARLHWLQHRREEEWRAAARWVTFGEYIDWRLFGVNRVSLSAAAWTGLLHVPTLSWDTTWQEILALGADQLGTLVDVDDGHIGLLPTWAQRWPHLATVPWYPAIGDGAAANVGSGCVDEQHVALTIGTTGAVRVALPGRPEPPFGLWSYRIDRQTALVGGAMSEGGNVYQWVTETMQMPAHGDELEHLLAAYAPDSHGLTVLPLWAGERSPGWAGDAQATIHGLRLHTTSVDVLRAALESVALRVAAMMTALPTPAEQRVVASGGALLHSPTWMQICADALGRTVYASPISEATARGVALLALRSLGVIATLDALPTPLTQAFVPDEAAHQRYQQAIQRQKALYDRLVDIPL
jgi:gluconokinase